MKIPFKKMSGAGNDFVVVDWRKGPGGVPWDSLAPAICDRRSGIGADGLIVIGPGTDTDFTMDYYNSDGSAGSMCGNGGRCAALHMMGQVDRGEVTFSACGQKYTAVSAGSGISLTMQNPGEPRLHLRLKIGTGTLTGHFIDTGAPHLVVRRDISGIKAVSGDEPDPGIAVIGRELRHHPEFANTGTNVDFITVDTRDRIRVRTYEKGVENETLACGTGAVASAAIYSILEGGEGTNRVTVVPKSGEELRVSFQRKGNRITDVLLEGPAVVTFTGMYELRG